MVTFFKHDFCFTKLSLAVAYSFGFDVSFDELKKFVPKFTTEKLISSCRFPETSS